MRRIVAKISRRQIMQVFPKVSLGALPMLISLEFGFSILAVYFATRFFSSAELIKKILGVTLLLILFEEFLREGYLFRPADLLVLRMTHEKAFLGLFFIGIVTEGYRHFKVNAKDSVKNKAV